MVAKRAPNQWTMTVRSHCGRWGPVKVENLCSAHCHCFHSDGLENVVRALEVWTGWPHSEQPQLPRLEALQDQMSRQKPTSGSASNPARNTADYGRQGCCRLRYRRMRLAQFGDRPLFNNGPTCDQTSLTVSGQREQDRPKLPLRIVNPVSVGMSDREQLLAIAETFGIPYIFPSVGR